MRCNMPADQHRKADFFTARQAEHSHHEWVQHFAYGLFCCSTRLIFLLERKHRISLQYRHLCLQSVLVIDHPPQMHRQMQVATFSSHTMSSSAGTKVIASVRSLAAL